MRNTITVNPARAGMIPLLTRSACSSACKPRASGDDPNKTFIIEHPLE